MAIDSYLPARAKVVTKTIMHWDWTVGLDWTMYSQLALNISCDYVLQW